MKPSKSGSLRTVIDPPPSHDSGWPEVPMNTLSPGQGLPWEVGGFLDQKEPSSPALQPHTTDGSLRVVDRTVEPFLVFGEPLCAAFWWFRYPPGSALEPQPLRNQHLLLWRYPLCAWLWPPIRLPRCPMTAGQ